MSLTINVLLIEDNPGDARLVQEMLKEDKCNQFIFYGVRTIAEAKKFLENNNVNVILLDLGLPDSQGLDAFLAINSVVSHIPIIILTGLQDETIAINAVKVGAQDYFLKNEINAALLSRAIIYSIERKNNDNKLRDFATIVEYAHEAIFTQTLDGTILNWNTGAEKIFGYDSSEIIGKNISLLHPPGCSKNEFDTINRKILLDESIVDYETIRCTKNGKLINVSLTMSPFRDIDQKIIGIIVIGRDITERKKSDQILAVEYRISTALAESSTIENAIYCFIKTICEVLEWDVGALWAINHEKAFIQCVSAWNRFEKHHKFTTAIKGLTLPINQGIPGYVWSTQKIYWAPDLKNDTQHVVTPLINEMGFTNCIAIPILFVDEILGVITFFSEKPHTIDINLLTMFYSLGEQIAGFIKRKRLEGDINYLSQHDFLTGLYNRWLLEKVFAEITLKAKAKHQSIAFLYLDLDGFKKINDTVGHATGDAVLIEVAARLRECVRETDVIGRMGGDEFILLIPDLNQITGIELVAKKLLDKISEPYRKENLEFHITVSIGISIYPNDGEDFLSLLKSADFAMYTAKEHGGNTFQFCNTQLLSQLRNKVILENDLLDALKNEDFILYYQPIVDAKTHKIVSVEALIRWHHKIKGILSPSEFIKVAEETRIIIPLGIWIIKTAFNQLKKFQEIDKDISVAINLSPLQFAQKKFMQEINSMIKDMGIKKGDVDFEVTENIFMESIVKNVEFFSSLRAIGTRISIDDFGTGYSSFSYLQNFIADIVKIDQSFISEISTSSKKSQLIINAIIAVAHALGMRVIAEGVETQEQVDFLVESKCDRLQGFYFSKPLPADKMLDLLKQNIASTK